MEIEEDCEDEVQQTNIEKTSDKDANDDFEEEDDYDDENNANCELLSHSEELNEPPKPIAEKKILWIKKESQCLYINLWKIKSTIWKQLYKIRISKFIVYFILNQN